MRLATRSKRLLLQIVLFAACFFTVNPSTTAFAAAVDQIRSSGEYATFYLTQPIYLNIYVSRSGSETFLSYDSYVFANDTSASGWGMIPNEDFTGNVNAGFTLKTDISRLVGDEKGTATGPIEIVWKPIQYGESSKSSGFSQYVYSGLITKTSGFSEWFYATASGTALSYPVNFGSGHVGKNNNTTITIERKSIQ